MARSTPSSWSRRQSVYYARLAVAHMNAGELPLAAIDVRMIRLLNETVPGSADQRRHVFGGLNRFLAWCVRQELIPVNPCAAIDPRDRPGPGKSRSHVPAVATLKGVWNAVEEEDELARDLTRFMLLMPLRRSEAAGLLWSEVSLDRIRILARRTKNGEPHELPLPPAAQALLEARRRVAAGNLVFASSTGAVYQNWDRLIARIRVRIGEDKNAKENRFSLHDIRRAFVSHLADQFDVDALDQCLGHVRGGTAGVYQRSRRWADRIRACNAWSDLITGTEPDSNIVPFVRA